MNYKRLGFISWLSLILCAALLCHGELSYGDPDAGGPEDGHGEAPPVLPTRPPTAVPGEMCDAYLFSHIQISRSHGEMYRTAYGKDILEGFVDIATYNGERLPYYVPNQLWDPNSTDANQRALAQIAASGTKPLYQLANNIPSVLQNAFDGWMLPKIKEGFDRFFDINNPKGAKDATDIFLNWRFWGWMYSQNKDSFVDGPLGRSYYADGKDVHPRNREVITINLPGNTVSNIGTDFADNFYFDKFGKLLADKPATDVKLCDAGVWYNMGCPLSLVMKDGYDLNSDVRITSFPIDPARAGQSFLWKASAEAPLLVFDPEHKGEITTARQLFGHFTFGGNAVAALDPASPGGLPRTWQDGFEALGSLDQDGSGAIDGDELAPLALWFDENRDGVSDRGEVKTLASQGIEKLFFDVTRSGLPGRDIELKIGYEKRVGGRLTTGRAVDWYSGSARSPHALVSSMLSFSQHGSDGSTYEPSDPSDAVAKGGKSKAHSPLEGGWKWQLAGEPISGPHGYLVIKAGKDGKLAGTNFALHPAPSDLEKSVGAVLQVSSITIGRSDDSRSSFSLYTPGGGQIKNDVTFSPDGSTMTGEARASVRVLGTTIVTHYRWTASRVAG